MGHRYQRDRSRDKHGYRGRSQSSDSYEKKKRKHHRSSSTNPPIQPVTQKKVKFNDVPDVKIFKKQDQPNSMGLTDTQMEEYIHKLQTEKGTNTLSNLNWQKMKHIDAQLQSNSIKEQKQKQKILTQKLQGIKQQISFYPPLILTTSTNHSTLPGHNSQEKTQLAAKLNDVLACFYVTEEQIPSQPAFQIQNKSPSLTPKIINFDKQRPETKDATKTQNKVQKKDQKPLKSILKMSNEEKAKLKAQSQPRKIDPSLITLLIEIQNNKESYTKEKTQMLLRPYKDSGELDYLKKNPTILSSLMMRDSISQPKTTRFPSEPKGSTLTGLYKTSHSVSPQSEKPTIGYMPPISYDADKPPPPPPPIQYHEYGHLPFNNYDPYHHYANYPNYQPPPQMPPHLVNQPMNPTMMNNYRVPPQEYPMGLGVGGLPPFSGFQQQNNSVQMINRNYKTVPCKYYHSSQGCVKANNCTFIHDQEYAGKPTPSMQKSNRGMILTSNSTDANGHLNSNMMYQLYPDEYYKNQS